MMRIGDFTRWFDDSIHPVAMRDMRRAVQNRFVFFGLLIVIIGIVVTSFSTVMDRMSSHGGSYSGAGGDLFDVIYYSVGAIMIVLMPMYLCMRVGDDLSDKNNLVEISTLRPMGRTWGFFTVGFIMMFMVASIALPYMMFCYMLGGLDLPTIFLKWLAIFILAMPAMMGGIFVGTLTSVKPLRLILSLAYAFGAVSTYIVLVDEWLGNIHATHIEIAEWFVISLLAGLLLIWFFLLASARLASPMTNRVLPLRIFATISFVILYAIGIVFLLIGKKLDLIGLWLVVSLITLAIMFLIAICEREEPGQRVQSSIPRKWWLRLAAWLFYSGTGGGICWCAIYAFLLVFLFDRAYHIYDAIKAPTSWDWDFHDVIVITITYFILCGYAYGMTAIGIRRMVLRARVTIAQTPIILFVVFMFVFLISGLVLFIESPSWLSFIDHTNAKDHIWLGINPINLCFVQHGEEVFLETGLWIFVCWSAVITLIILPWFIWQFKEFKPLDDLQVKPADTKA